MSTAERDIDVSSMRDAYPDTRDHHSYNKSSPYDSKSPIASRPDDVSNGDIRVSSSATKLNIIRSAPEDRDRDRDYRTRDDIKGKTPQEECPEAVIEDRVNKRKITIVEDEIARYTKKDLNYFKQLERDEYIAFASQIHPRVVERDIFQFFAPVGRVVDIKLVRDSRTGKSKGLCYIEFEDKSSVTKACALSGHLLSGYPVTIEPTANARTRNNVLTKERERLQSLSRRVTLSNIPFDVTSQDIRQLCSEVCTIEHTELIHISPDEAVAFIECRHPGDATLLIKLLNGVTLGGRTLDARTGVVKPTVLKHEYDYNPIVTAEATNGSGELALSGMGLTSLIPAAIAPAVIPVATGMSQPTTVSTGPGTNVASLISTVIAATSQNVNASQCVILSNLLDPKVVDDIDREDIYADVIEEGSKFGKIYKAHLDKNGNMFVLFDKIDNAIKAQKVFHGRWFDDRKLSCVFAKPSIVKAKFPDWNI